MSGPIVQDLGKLEGDVLLFGGPYSNLEATQALLGEAEKLGVSSDHVICTGDVAAYCADPEATAEALKARCVLVAGNCERQLADGAADCGCGFEDGSACDLLASAWYPYALARVSDASRSWIASAPDLVSFVHAGRRVAVLHGGMTDIARYVWPSSEATVFSEEIALVEAQIGKVDMIVAGHCGIAFQRQSGDVLWVNSGVIGMPPHDGRTMTRFAVLSEEGVRFERLDYDHQTAAKKMRSTGLPEGYALALESGIWPSEDVLPLALRG